MNFSLIYENHFLILLWVTTIGLFISLTEATLRIKYEKSLEIKKRNLLIKSLYPKKLA